MNDWAAQLISQDVADSVGKCWGVGSDTAKDQSLGGGAAQHVERPSGRPWFHGGNLHKRVYSLLLPSNQARQVGIGTRHTACQLSIIVADPCREIVQSDSWGTFCRRLECASVRR